MGRLISAGELNSPWGITMSPASFAAAPNRLLVGNFGDGRINVYNLNMTTSTAQFEGPLRNSTGGNIAIDGLWSLKFAPSGSGFDPAQLYYTAGPDDETHGVFGRIQAAASTSSNTSTNPGSMY